MCRGKRWGGEGDLKAAQSCACVKHVDKQEESLYVKNSHVMGLHSVTVVETPNFYCRGMDPVENPFDTVGHLAFSSIIVHVYLISYYCIESDQMEAVHVLLLF